jgi:tetratricopeptide (TPR) repeat protein
LHLEAARALRPNDPDARRWLARAWLQLNQPTDVLSLLEANSATRKEDAWIHVLRARAFDALNREQETIEELSRALALDPGAAGARFALGFLAWTARDLTEAERQFRVELAFNPNLRQAQFYLAEVLMTQARLGEAENVVSRMAGEHPECFLTQFALGKLEERQGDLEAAQGHYREAIRLDPHSMEAHYRLGITLRRAGKGDEAQREFDRAHALRASDSRRAHQGMGLSRSRIPDFDL